MTSVPPKQEPAAFISYSRADSEFALQLARDLKAAGAHVWLDQLDIHAGHEWDNAIEAALVAAPQMLLILSPSSASSRNVRNEVALALDEGKSIIPILHRDCTIPLQLRRIQHIDFRTDYAGSFSSLLKHLGVDPGAPSQPAVPASPAAQPVVPAAAKPVEARSSTVAQPREQSPLRAEHWTRRLRQFWLIVPLAGILIALMMSDLGDFMGVSVFDSSNPCALTDASQSSISARMYLPIAKWALRYTPSPSVAIIYIDPAHDPPDLLTNVCASRAFLARLVPALNTLNAHVIVIDKYYSADACAEQDQNNAFINAVESSKVPIVVGQQTHALPQTSTASGCLALTPKLEFGPSSNVHYGLTRIDNDDLKIPLRIPVYPDPATIPGTHPAATASAAPAPLPAAAGDTLSLVAAKLVNPRLESNHTLSKLLATLTDPYTTFLNLPHITALTALCSAEPSPRAPIDGQPGDALCKPWVRDPDNLDGNQLSLAGKIVIVGDISDADLKPFPSSLAPFPPGTRPGVFMQANYIQALLDHRFLQQIPTPVTLGLLVVYVLIVYVLYWAHDEAGHPRLTLERAGLWSLAALAGMVGVSFLVLVTLSYYTPLWALWGAGVFMVFRYLEASGHHRSQHLLGHLAGHHHAAEHPAPVPASNDSDRLTPS